MTFISIIIPFKKSKRYLRDCLESIYEQNLNDYEIILIVNGSDENIDDLIKSDNNLKKPMLFYTYDLDKYEQELRGFYIDIYSEVPGPLLKTTEEVIDAINNIEEISSQYSEKYDAFYDKFCSLEDGGASKRIFEKVWSESK